MWCELHQQPNICDDDIPCYIQYSYSEYIARLFRIVSTKALFGTTGETHICKDTSYRKNMRHGWWSPKPGKKVKIVTKAFASKFSAMQMPVVLYRGDSRRSFLRCDSALRLPIASYRSESRRFSELQIPIATYRNLQFCVCTLHQQRCVRIIFYRDQYFYL